MEPEGSVGALMSSFKAMLVQLVRARFAKGNAKDEPALHGITEAANDS